MTQRLKVVAVSLVSVLSLTSDTALSASQVPSSKLSFALPPHLGKAASMTLLSVRRQFKVAYRLPPSRLGIAQASLDSPLSLASVQGSE